MIEILLSDPLFLVINKPSGILTTSTFGVPSIQTILREQLAENLSADREPFVEPPHRLDRGTTGALLIASTRKSLSNLSQQFLHRQIRKRYLVAIPTIAIPTRTETQAQLLLNDGTLEDWMRKIPDVAQAEVVTKDTQGAKQAILNYRTLYQNEKGRILEIEMKTGRMHQIRLQFASRGYPILGDRAYGSNFDWIKLTDTHQVLNDEDQSHVQHTALHASHLAFRHPKDASWVIVNAPVCQTWKDHFSEFDFASVSNQGSPVV